MSIDIPEYALAILNRLESYGFEAYVVGGCVRDVLLGLPPQDWDICTNARPEEVLQVFRRFHVIKTGLKHGTVTVVSHRQPVEVTTFRLDGEYTDNRHPDNVQFVSRVEEDLSRRDFTINAMAYSPTRGLVDAYGGQEDLKAHLIRCVGEPDTRFHEDGLRILRALRFASRFNFDIERETSDAVRRNRQLLNHISAERILKELKGILVGDGVLNMLLAYPEIFATIIPELEATIGFDQHNPHHCHDVWTHSAHAVAALPRSSTLRLAMLMHDIAKPVCYSFDIVAQRGHFYGHPQRGAEMAGTILRRLKSDLATQQQIITLISWHDLSWPTTLAGMRSLIGKLGLETVRQLFLIKRADQAAQSSFEQEQKQAEMRAAFSLFQKALEIPSAFTFKDLCINGKDLMALGLPAGPEMGAMLETLLKAVQEDKVNNSTEALSSYAQKLLGDHSADRVSSE